MDQTPTSSTVDGPVDTLLRESTVMMLTPAPQQQKQAVVCAGRVRFASECTALALLVYATPGGGTNSYWSGP